MYCMKRSSIRQQIIYGMTWLFYNSLWTHLHSILFYFYLCLEFGNVRIENSEYMDGHGRNNFIKRKHRINIEAPFKLVILDSSKMTSTTCFSFEIHFIRFLSLTLFYYKKTKMYKFRLSNYTVQVGRYEVGTYMFTVFA